MKNNYKLLAVCLLVCSSFSAIAQNGVKFGAKAGVALGKFSFSEDLDEGSKSKSNLSFFIGGNAEIAITESFSFQPGVTLIGKGTKLESNFEGLKNSNSINLMNLEIPLNFVGKIPAGSGNVFLGAGPYFGFSLAGKTKSEATFEGETEKESEKIEFGKDGDLKRSEFGVNIIGGYQLSNGVSLNLGYGLGLSNINQSEDFKAKTRTFTIGVGFSL